MKEKVKVYIYPYITKELYLEIKKYRKKYRV